MIGSILYVIASQPDVMQAVGQVARFQATPKFLILMPSKKFFDILREQ